MINEIYSLPQVADILSVSKSMLYKWEKNEKLIPITHPTTGEKSYFHEQLLPFSQAKKMFDTQWDEEKKTRALRPYHSIELFAGAGGLALGLEKAGIHAKVLNEILCYFKT